jgi:hypothetical protein
MSQWKNDDSAANSVLWGVSGYKVPANSANRNAFFGNTTADALITGITVGQYGVDTSELRATRQNGENRPAHAGWVNRTVGSGGRAGRIQHEVLVAMGSMSADAEDAAFPDYAITITTQPSGNTANTTAAQQATFRVVAASVPTGATLSYQWTYANGTTLASGANVGVTTAANLVVNSGVVTTNTSFKVTVSATGADNKVSSNAVLTITT